MILFDFLRSNTRDGSSTLFAFTDVPPSSFISYLSVSTQGAGKGFHLSLTSLPLGDFIFTLFCPLPQHSAS
jgi:hypothetical protein